MQPRPSAPSSSDTPEGVGLHLRPTRVEDGAAMWQFIADHGGLEANTAYAYLVLADDFSDSCIVAVERGSEPSEERGSEPSEDGDTLAGFVLGYRPPSRPDTLFVWQVGVAPSHRGQGLARRMIVELLDRMGARYLESTVTPSNTASRRLFRSVAEAHDTTCHVSEYLTEDHFPGGGHEAEEKFRIGPL